MSDLDRTIAASLQGEGELSAMNRAYLALFAAQLYVPTEGGQVVLDDDTPDRAPEKEPMPLFIEHNNAYFLLAFDSLEKLQAWAGDYRDEIGWLQTSGKNLISSLKEQTYLCLNFGAPNYKEFSPDEIMRLRQMMGRIQQMHLRAQQQN